MNLTDGLRVHAAHARVELGADVYLGPVWTDGERMYCLYHNQRNPVAWNAAHGCYQVVDRD